MDGASSVIKVDNAIDVHTQRFVPDPQAVSRLSREAACAARALPIAFDSLKNQLLLATELSHDTLVTQQLRNAVAESTDVHFASLICSDYDALINRCYSSNLQFDDVLPECGAEVFANINLPPSEIHPLIRLLDNILHEAVCQRASDIHISGISVARCRIRFRVDGVLSTWRELQLNQLAPIVVRIKLLASMDIAESRLAQDGQLNMQIQGGIVNFRVSSFPTLYGENMVLRVLDKSAMVNKLPLLLAETVQLEKIRACRHLLDGLTIVCGPTGCGKSTTLLSMLSELDSESLNIMTLEDPVENTVQGIQQCSVRAEIEFDYAEATRALLRQDPDVLLIGEIRDSKSAAMAFRAALTGHGVFTTVHCRDTESAISRLLDLGVGYSGIASCVNLILAQRLIRRLCEACANDSHDREGSSCSRCNGSGYFGRSAVLEIMPVTDSVRTLLCTEAPPAEIRKQAVQEGMQSLSQQVDLLIERGVTDQAEKHRVLGEA